MANSSHCRHTDRKGIGGAIGILCQSWGNEQKTAVDSEGVLEGPERRLQCTPTPGSAGHSPSVAADTGRSCAPAPASWYADGDRAPPTATSHCYYWEILHL